MKELNEEDRKALIQYRLERSSETYAEAVLLNNNGFYNAAMSRLYYSCYYVVEALLVQNKINATTHAGVKQMLGKHFVLTKLISKEYGQFFSIIFERRHSSDYDDFIRTTQEEVNTFIPKAAQFIETIKKLIIEP
ncbi:MAG: HEPN domain-containing protein [Bacteroidales bacterium]|nr:HEPN domain-containing protein [Bacteroidales bacterium]